MIIQVVYQLRQPQQKEEDEEGYGRNLFLCASLAEEEEEADKDTGSLCLSV